MSGAPAPKGKSASNRILGGWLANPFHKNETTPVQPITAPPPPAPLTGLPPLLAHMATTVGTGAAPQAESGWRTETASAPQSAQGAAHPGLFYGGKGGGAYAGGFDRDTGYGGSLKVRCGAKGGGSALTVPLPAFHRSPSVAAPGAGADTRATYVQVSTYGATQSQPAAKRPRLDDAAARRQPNPLGAPVPSVLTHPELRVMPGEVDEVVVQSSEAWIGA
jgi:hypothetical protein